MILLTSCGDSQIDVWHSGGKVEWLAFWCDGGLVCSVRWWSGERVVNGDLVICICSELNLAISYRCMQVTL